MVRELKMINPMAISRKVPGYIFFIFGLFFCMGIWTIYIKQEFRTIQSNLTQALKENTESRKASLLKLMNNDLTRIKFKNKILVNETLIKWLESVDKLIEEYGKFEKKSAEEKAKVKVQNKTDFAIDKDRGYWSGNGSGKWHLFDEPLAKGLTNFFKLERANDIIDLGGGMGLYTKYFCSNGLISRCYDGNPDSQELSKGQCAVLDFTKEINFLPFDWVLSLEVGEHLPVKFESTYLQNIDRLNRKGAVISWATVGQSGSGHVNNRNNDYVIQKMKALNYTYDEASSTQLRKNVALGWFRNTLMTFRKLDPILNNKM